MHLPFFFLLLSLFFIFIRSDRARFARFFCYHQKKVAKNRVSSKDETSSTLPLKINKRRVKSHRKQAILLNSTAKRLPLRSAIAALPCHQTPEDSLRSTPRGLTHKPLTLEFYENSLKADEKTNQYCYFISRNYVYPHYPL